jgi:hypothetical protein
LDAVLTPQPIRFESKIHRVGNVVVGGTGMVAFIEEARKLLEHCVPTMDEILESPESVASWLLWYPSFHEITPTSINMFGFSDVRQEFVGVTFTAPDFAMVEKQAGTIYIRPAIPQNIIDYLDKGDVGLDIHMSSLVMAQCLWEKQIPGNERTGIGGDVIYWRLYRENGGVKFDTTTVAPLVEE